jgi:HNH endonuclease
MKVGKRRNEAWLLATALAVAKELKRRNAGTRLRIRLPSRAAITNTDGWRVLIGDLGKSRPRLEIWLDRFSGHDDRKLWACFSGDRRSLTTVTKKVSKNLVPHRIITPDDTDDDKYLVLTRPLRRDEFNQPILEQYADGATFFGIYDLTRQSSQQLETHFRAGAAAFFESVARTLPRAKAEDDLLEVYPQIENRKLVKSHLLRERSRLLATARKIIDKYVCQVCGLHFEDVYGAHGTEFAEAHHVVPLRKLRENVRTRIQDLTTVCANCHRMLHRMAGKRDDITRLRTIVRKRRRKR